MSRTRTRRLRVALCGTLWALVSLPLVAAPGCYGRNCDGSVEIFGHDPDGGELIEPNTWVSGPPDGDWLPFPRQRVWVFDIPSLGGRTPDLVIPYISTSPNPSVSGDFTIAAGNHAKQLGARPNGINIYNDTCTDYYLRLVVQVGPLPPSPASDGASALE
jgi:hypothetical protein